MLASTARVSRRSLAPRLSLSPTLLPTRPCHARSLHSSVTAEQPPLKDAPTPAPAPTPARKPNLGPKVKNENRTAFIRTLTLLDSLPKALAVLRAVEQKYGPVTDFKFKRDDDIPKIYQTYIHVVFRDEESVQALPPTGAVQTFHIRTPEYEQNHPGGPSLQEVAGLLRGREKDAAFVSITPTERDPSLISFTISRALNSLYLPSAHPYHNHSRLRRLQNAANFVKWGGFYEMEKIDPNRTINDEELFGPSTLDHVRMRRALRKNAAFANVPNPYEFEQRKPSSKESVEVKKGEASKPVEVKKEVKASEPVEASQPVKVTEAEAVPLLPGVEKSTRQREDTTRLETREEMLQELQHELVPPIISAAVESEPEPGVQSIYPSDLATPTDIAAELETVLANHPPSHQKPHKPQATAARVDVPAAYIPTFKPVPKLQAPAVNRDQVRAAMRVASRAGHVHGEKKKKRATKKEEKDVAAGMPVEFKPVIKQRPVQVKEPGLVDKISSFFRLGG